MMRDDQVHEGNKAEAETKLKQEQVRDVSFCMGSRESVNACLGGDQ